MKIIILNILSVIILISCSNQTDSIKKNSQQNNDSLNLIAETPVKIQKIAIKLDKSELPADGKYRYDIAFAEWDGDSMGEKVTVVIKGDSIKIIYEGDGQLSLAKKGDVLDSGIIRKHISGNFIISQDEDDVYIEEIGGCTGGPSIIDFKTKKFWMC